MVCDYHVFTASLDYVYKERKLINCIKFWYITSFLNISVNGSKEGKFKKFNCKV